jgi:hypothetical protein
MIVKVEVTLEVDTDAYLTEYGLEPQAIPGDVESYLVDLLSYCNAGASGCWVVRRLRTWKGRK